jgi:uncharacterized damage-inducible protein DinB
LPEAALTTPGVSGDWSVRDLLAHITTWEGEFLKALPTILADKRVPHYSTLYGGIDAFNAQQQEQSRTLSLAGVRAAMDKTHAALLDAVRETPTQEKRIEARLRRRLRQDTYHHYGVHIAQLEEWRP